MLYSVTVHYSQWILIKISQGKRCTEQGPEDFKCRPSTCPFLEECCEWHLLLPVAVCNNTYGLLTTRELPQALVSIGFIEAPSHRLGWPHAWSSFISSPSGAWVDTTWPKALIINHTASLDSLAWPKAPDKQRHLIGLKMTRALKVPPRSQGQRPYSLGKIYP